MYYDAIGYCSTTLQCTIDLVGHERLMFGSDHPFFPPPKKSHGHVCDEPWPSTFSNFEALSGYSDEIQRDILYRNAQLFLEL